MIDHETAVRDAASNLRRAIADANAAGLYVAWPRNAEGLDLIAISLTGKAPIAAAETEVATIQVDQPIAATPAPAVRLPPATPIIPAAPAADAAKL